MLSLNKILKVIGVAVFAAVFVWVGMYLFFEEEYNATMSGLKGFFTEPFEREVPEEIVVIEPLPMQGFEPTIFDPATRQRLNNIYESLIKPDENLNMEPCLALSWGLLSDTVWEFNLRNDVKFHDGSVMDVLDVIESIDRARGTGTGAGAGASNSQLKDLLSTIKEVRRMSATTIEIETNEPDPLLLQRLATVYVTPAEGDGIGVGTGAYRVAEVTEIGDLVLERFGNYWGDEPRIPRAVVKTISDPVERMGVFAEGGADVLDYVPYDLAEGVAEVDGAELYSMPSLEVQFLVFNFRSHVFNDVRARRAVQMAVNGPEFASVVGEYAHYVPQFVSSGVFGYDPEISAEEYDLDGAGELISQVEIEEGDVTIILPVGFEVLGDYLVGQLKEIGLDPYIQYVKSEYYEQVLSEMPYDMYFMGFRSELGDAGDFMASVAHSRGGGAGGYGQYNYAYYDSDKVDKLIEGAEVTMQADERLGILQNVMAILVAGDVFGVPLLEYETLFAASPRVDFEPRIDGFIYLQDL